MFLSDDAEAVQARKAVLLVQQAYQLTNEFIVLDYRDRVRSLEMVFQLRQLVEELRELH